MDNDNNPNENEAHLKKYNPGHYVAISERGKVDDIKYLDEPAVRGVSKRYPWKMLEPTKGEYDFSAIRSDLEFLGRHKKQLVLRDKFGHEMLRKGIYTPGQIDTRWTDEIKNSFLKWLDENPGELPMSREDLDEYMKQRTW